MLFIEERGKLEYSVKTSQSGVENQQTQPMRDVKDRIKPGPHW